MNNTIKLTHNIVNKSIISYYNEICDDIINECVDIFGNILLVGTYNNSPLCNGLLLNTLWNKGIDVSFISLHYEEDYIQYIDTSNTKYSCIIYLINEHYTNAILQNTLNNIKNNKLKFCNSQALIVQLNN